MKFLLSYLVIAYYCGEFGKADLASGRCQDVEGMAPFNATGILGRWYLYEVNEIISAFVGKCTTFTFQRKSANSSNFQLLVSNGAVFAISHTCKMDEVGDTSKFQQRGLFGLSSPFYVMDTNYNTYLVAYTCLEIFGFAHDRNVLVMTRERHPSDSVIGAAENSIEENGLGDTRSYFKINQDGC